MPAVVELRQYTLHPGQRDTLIELFDREFVESQDACGMVVLGQFRDLDDPDRFVWLRGFADMESRRIALGDFYGGPVWKANSAAANATMIDSDDVLLLRPDDDALDRLDVAARDGATTPRTVLVSIGEGEIDAPLLTRLRTLDAENTFPALPVRTDGPWVVELRSFPDEPSARAFAAEHAASQHLVLQPTSRSMLRP